MRHHLDLDFDASAVDGLSFSSRLTSPVHIRKGRFLFFASHHCPFSSSPRRRRRRRATPFISFPLAPHTHTNHLFFFNRTNPRCFSALASPKSPSPWG